MTRRTERFHVDIEATPADIWRMLTTAEGLASWFGTRASIDLRLDGAVEVGWGDDETITSRISALDPHRRLRLAYLVDGEEVGAEEWLVTTSAATTRLTLIHSMPDDGIDDWDGFYGDVRRGWRLFLASLRHALEDAASPFRTASSNSLPMAGDREPIWATVTTAVGLADDGLTADRATATGLRVILADPPHSLLLASADHTLLCDVEGTGEHQHLYLQAATHSGDPAWNDRMLTWLADRLQS